MSICNKRSSVWLTLARVLWRQDVTERKASEAAFQLRDHALSNLSEVRALALHGLIRFCRRRRVAALCVCVHQLVKANLYGKTYSPDLLN